MYESALITGGAGFVGASLALALRRRFPDLRLVALDNLHRRGSELNLRRLREAGIAFVHGDIRAPEDFVDLPQLPGVIIECSAEPSAQAGYGGSPEYLIRTNLVGCFHCLELARRARADFIFLSTSRVYPGRKLNALSFREETDRFALADEQLLPGASGCGISEDFPLEGTRSLYGMTKLASELMIAEYADAYGLGCAINRCGLIAGPGQMGKTDQGVIALWVAAHYFRRPLSYIGFGGQGKQVRDVLHIDDLCELVMAQVLDPGPYQGRVFNAGGGAPFAVSLRELTALCREVTGNEVELGSSPQDRPADIRIYVTDHRRLTQASGWSPRRDPRQVVVDICNWLRAEESTLRGIFSA
jgi:CDP-paratose 2-epimerase